MKINGILASIQSARATKPLGQLATTPLKSGEKYGLFRAAIPADIPETAIVTVAEIVLHAREAWGSSLNIAAQRNDAGFKPGRATWSNRPGVTGSASTVAVPSAVVGTEIRIPVTPDVQSFVAGSVANRGWRITSSSTTSRDFFGASANRYQPYLEFSYVVPATAPTDLVPDGAAVSIAKPTMTFSVPEGTLAIQVQIDGDADGIAPTFDSGEVSSPAGLLDLSRTDLPGGTFAGLTLGVETFWRARAKNALGWSAWSNWASVSRVAKPTVTITSPGATTGDNTPPVTWTASGQVAWRARLLKADGTVLDDSEQTNGTGQEWTPDQGLKRVGDVGRYEVRVWDNVDRVATPGDPVYSIATFDFTLVANSVAPGVDALFAVVEAPSPVVRLDWASVTTDAWQIVRDGEWLEKVDGSLRTYRDYTARPGIQHVYQVLAATDAGATSPNGPTATVTVESIGEWLMNPDTDERVMILDDDPTVNMDERAVLHVTLGDRAPVRRRSGTPPPSGTMTGTLLDSLAGDDYEATAMIDAALGFKDSDQVQVFRQTIGSWNLPVTIGNLTITPARDHAGQPVALASYAWWATEHPQEA